MESRDFSDRPTLLQRSARALGRIIAMPQPPSPEGIDLNIGEAGLRAQGLAQARQDFLRARAQQELPPDVEG